MKKILLLCDGDNFPSAALRFIRQMRDSEPIYVKGMFFTPVDTLEMLPVSFIPIDGPYQRLREDELIKVHESKHKFTDAFKNTGIKHDLHSYEGPWDANLFKTESRFADLVIISNGLFHLEPLESLGNHFMMQALRYSESPVVVIPEKFTGIERLAIAYDGEKECMHAMKQFLYIFPALAELPTEIVHASEKTTEDIPNRELLREYTLSHFDSQYTSNLPFNPKKYFGSWLEERKNVMLITGSFSRSSFSNNIRKSFAEQIITEQTCPLFVAHTS